MTGVNNPSEPSLPSQTLQTIKQYFIGSPSYIADPHTTGGCAESVYPKVRLIIISTCKSIYLIYRIILYERAVRRTCCPPLTGPSSLGQAAGFERDVFPQEFRGVVGKERRVVDLDESNKELVKKAIERKVGSALAGNGV
jgi:threonine synthase